MAARLHLGQLGQIALAGKRLDAGRDAVLQQNLNGPQDLPDFAPFAESLELHDWDREPDYSDRYRERWELCLLLLLL